MRWHHQNIWILVYTVCILGYGCSQQPVDIVQNNRLEIDPSVTIGEALTSYSYFGHTQWKSFKDDHGMDIVEFRGVIDYDRFIGSMYLGTQLTPTMIEHGKNMLGSLVTTYIAQFARTRQNNEFHLKYSALHRTGTKLQTEDSQATDIIDKDFHLFQFIYLDVPEPVTYDALLTASL